MDLIAKREDFAGCNGKGGGDSADTHGRRSETGFDHTPSRFTGPPHPVHGPLVLGRIGADDVF